MSRTFKILFFLLLIFTFSCSTKKNTATRRFYHRLVSKYNIFFNGNEAFKQGVYQLEEKHKDDFSKIIEVFPYGSESDAAGIASNMDRANEKASKVILKHSMFFDNQEYNKWVKESYLLIGKARFFKRDYLAASETFDFFQRKYTNDNLRTTALLWLAKTYLYDKRYGKCEGLFNLVDEQIKAGKASKEVIRLLPMVKTQYYVKTDNLTEAAKTIEEALKLKHPRKDKIRLYFIAGQINQALGKNDKALEYYQKTLKLNPPYDFAFRAKIFSAQCISSKNKANETIMKQLNKMLKDSKNKDYFDEIYYALAQIELSRKDTSKAIHYLKLSTASSTANQKQKGISFLKLAELHFDLHKYDEAKLYYDSTMLFLPKNYENYESIKEKSQILTQLINHLQAIQLQDSLQRLSKLSEKELLAKIDKMINERIQKEQLEKQKQKEKEQALAGQQNYQQNRNLQAGIGGAWYFYNNAMINLGKAEFKKRWGERKLEDLWRLNNKQIISFDDFQNIKEKTAEKSASDTLKDNQNPKKREYYLSAIPKTPEQIKESNKIIEDSYYNAASIYKNELQDCPPAIKLFNELLKRFPDTDYKLRTYYNLYLCHKKLNNTKEAEKYKNLILTEYPESEFAKIISDPNYFQNLSKQSSEISQLYSKTYFAFLDENHSQVINYATQAKAKFNDPVLIPKFEYLKAVSLIKTGDKEKGKSTLEGIVKNYPSSEVKPLASELIKVLSNENISKSETVITENTKPLPDKKSDIYSFNPSAFHLFTLILDVKNSNINEIKIKVSDFNKTYFRDKNLTISSLYLTDSRQMITVNRFNNKEEAEKYYNQFTNLNTDTSILKEFSNLSPIAFIISTENYPIFYNKKDEEGYYNFFINNYFKK